MLAHFLKQPSNDVEPQLSCVANRNVKDLIVASSTEIIGVILGVCLIDRLGRSKSQGLFYTVAALALLLLAFQQLEIKVLVVVASLARLALMAGSCTTWVQTPELYPTKVRAQVHTSLNLLSKLGAICAPFMIRSLNSLQSGLILSAVASVAAAVAVFLPETKGRELSESSEALSMFTSDPDSTSSEDSDGS